MRDFERLTRALEDVFAGIALPKTREVRQVIAVARILRGESFDTVGTDLKLQKRGVEALVARVRANGLAGLTSYADKTAEQSLAKRRQGSAQMLLGVLAERRFEELSNQITGGGVLRIEDHRPSRTDTDYRLLNGSNNPICRFNIKFHGTSVPTTCRDSGRSSTGCLRASSA